VTASRCDVTKQAENQMEFGFPRRTLCAAFIMACLPLAAPAATPFEEGLSAFKQQDYRQAVKLFERSRAEGIDSPVLDFNLASSYYKLEQYDAAKRYYRAATRDETLAGLSYYNLGLIALKQHDEQAAYQAFRSSFESSRDDRVRLLAARRLETLQPAPAATARPGRFSAFVSLTAAHDDNVANLSDVITTVSNKEDNYLDLFGIVTYQLSGTRDDGVQLRGGLIKTRYSSLNIYNEDLLSAGAYLYKPLGQWYTRTGLVFYHDTLGGHPFQQRLALQFNAYRYYASGQRLRFRYDLTHHNDLDARYAYLNGTRQRLGIEHRSRKGKHELNLGYRYEWNARNDYSTATSFFSYSPVRHTLFGEYEYRVTTHWAGRMNYEYRHSDYGVAHVSKGVDLGVQQDDRDRYGLTGVYRLDRDTDFELGWQRTLNYSNYASERYNSSVVMLRANLFFK
jgi:tetratricopeptide (TPR) repeat protein